MKYHNKKKRFFEIKSSYLLLFLSCLLFLIIIFLYNKSGGEVSAQEKIECNVEIPIGETMDESESLALNMIDTIEFIIQTSEATARAAEELAFLPDQCQCQGKCQARCRESYYFVNVPYPCPCSYNPDQICTCWRTERRCKCELGFCEGEPCPTNQINEKVRQIEDGYKKIKIAYEGGELNGEKIDGIKGLIKKISDIFLKLGNARNKLRSCASSTEDYQKFLAGGEFSTPLLFSCDYAKQIDSTLGECYQNNYFCCQ